RESPHRSRPGVTPRVASGAIWLAVCALSMAFAMPAAAAEAMFPTASRLGLAPPAGFVIAKSFSGFESRDKGAFIRLVVLPANAFREIEKTMTDAALKREGMTVEKRETIALPGGKAI